MKAGARNQIRGKVTAIKTGAVMAHVKFTISAGGSMASVLTTESLEELGLKVGDEVTLLVKAVNVLPVKE
jgi:molybdate transport system regulatory protein